MTTDPAFNTQAVIVHHGWRHSKVALIRNLDQRFVTVTVQCSNCNAVQSRRENPTRAWWVDWCLCGPDFLTVETVIWRGDGWDSLRNLVEDE